MRIKYGLSTSWCSGRHTDGLQLLNDLLSTEIAALELDYRIKAWMTEPLLKGLQHNRIEILSLHHPFPHPAILRDDKPSGDAILLSSLDSSERELAVKYARKTIQTAADLEAQAVVFHLGHVDIDKEQAVWCDLCENQEIDSEKGRRFVARKMNERKENQRPNLDAVLKSIDKIHEEAVRLGVLVGIENRYIPTEIPSFDEIGILLEEFAGGNLGYWHDCGHAQACEIFGLEKHSDFLTAYGKRMIGMHLHDSNGHKDHRPPGQGTIQFELLLPYLNEKSIRILEIHKCGVDELHDGIVNLKERGIL